MRTRLQEDKMAYLERRKTRYFTMYPCATLKHYQDARDRRIKKLFQRLVKKIKG